ncbi:hypothetical protein Taro_055959 [Colocasia esculenta]|uniref:Uncharacterized protein n=1 Tax=Colocasia esculenta TaxID=4460 RepID=A0A843XV50_COLES|nr:hypothetical protein [Colocasia esculenta]
MISGSVGGYNAEYLSPKEQERFTFAKSKICGNKAVDVQNLEKSGMSSLVEALRRMQWMDVVTFTEVSYPDLVKAFFICLKSEADGSLVSTVKGTQIKIDYDLLHELFGVKTSGFSGIHFVNDEVKGLRIIGPVDVSGAVVEKMGQSIRSRNLKKSGFSVQDGIWSKTSVTEGEVIIGDFPEVQEQAAAAAVEEAAAAEQAAAVVQAAAVTVVASQAEVSKSPVVEMNSHSPEVQMEEGAAGTQQDVVMKEAPSQGEQSILEPEVSESVAEGHLEQIVLEDASAQGEQESVELPAPIQGEQVGIEEIPPPASVPVSEGTSASNINLEEPVIQQGKQKRVAHKRPRKSHRKVNLKPVMALLKAQGEILSSVQTSIQGILFLQGLVEFLLELLRADPQMFLGHQGLQLQGQQGLQLQGQQGHQLQGQQGHQLQGQQDHHLQSEKIKPKGKSP